MSTGIAKQTGHGGLTRRQAAREFRAADRKLRKAARTYASWALNIDSSEDHEGADAARSTTLIKRQNLENYAAKLREDIFHDYDDDFDADDAWGLVVLLKQQAEAVEMLPFIREE